MRNIVEHGHTRGSSDTTVLSGCSSSSRLTRWISVPTPMTEPAGASSTARMMKSVDPTSSAISTTSWAHSGWTNTRPSGCSARKAATCSGRKRWWTEQCPFHSSKVASFTSASSRPPISSSGFHTRMSDAPQPSSIAGVAAEVLVGEEQDLVALGRAGRRPGRAPS